MNIMTRAVRLAVFVEAVSCSALLYQANPESGWNSWCVALGWPTRIVSDVLLVLFSLVHFPVLFLTKHLFGTLGFSEFNGRLVFSSPLDILVMLLQCALWSFVFFGLFHLEKRIILLFRRSAVGQILLQDDSTHSG